MNRVGPRGAITLRPMTRDDIPLGMRLKDAAGWNQTTADWEMLLSCAAGAFVATIDGVDAGTATVIDYERRFSWVGMVLVDPAQRRRGVGTRLLHAAIDHAASFGPVRLDATPLGKQLYDTLGFWDEHELARMERPASPTSQTRWVAASPAVRPMAAADVAQVVAYDAPIFGAQRTAILTGLYANRPQYAHFAVDGGHVTGYCLGRAGSKFEQIGPIVADSEERAQALLLAALARCGTSAVIVDAVTDHANWVPFLDSLGFAEQRPFIRMCRGELRHPGEAGRQYAIAGPELG